MANLPPLFIDIPRNPIFAVGLPVALGLGTGFLTRNGTHSPGSAWYKSLTKPSFQPPAWAFGVVWPLLYVSMGWASHLNVKALDRTLPGLGRDQAKFSLALYYGQLALNMAWSPLMFAAGNITAALASILALDTAALTWALNLRKTSQDAALLTIPYLAWLAYATAINASLWYDNGGKDSVNRLVGKAEKEGKKLGREAEKAADKAADKADEVKKEL
ncbi:unnamed protein product [Tilletia controversa]|uniref:TspO/MBR-related protein n=1 Tax=Tilletia controversa TaxID=13291 RepID=A0A8X7SVL0_9BASI|nr:hypothetical protein CF328_g6595 [Tilletia controversa]KAE8243964.1 hypothetical protein A4X06_0g6036 [Tilletia controversa]CAD6903754.1 unnamed protein product [Tilletia controversa]CAD6973027.1 unnamed protein product [Tilletia controversa]CAD6984086.1 unnamed protein product [Tilletia controversa]